MLDFIKEKKSSLLKDNKIYLGSFDLDKEIKSNQTQTTEFLKNIINYALLRDQFREQKKLDRQKK